MPSLAGDLRLALDRVSFASSLGLDPDPWQERLLRSTSPRVLLNCSRQSGKSTMSGLIALHRALYFPGSPLVLCLAPSERQSKELFAKVSDSYRRLRGTPAPASDRKLGMHLPNGSRIEALPGSERTVRGFSGTSLLIVDEAARVDDELYYAVRPMLAVSGGALMMLSTPFGKRGVFYEEWTGGEGWERYEVPAAQCPRIPDSFLEEERRVLPSWVFRQEYECSFEETEDQVFTTEMVERAVTPEITPLFGAAKMPFHIGLDLGQAADYTALAVVHSVQTRIPDGQTVKGLHLRHLERYPLRMPYPQIVENVAALVRDEKLSPTEYDPSRGRYSSQPPVLVVDNTGVGVAVTDLLKGKGLRFTPVTITGGDTAHKASGNWRVPKRDLVAALEVPFHTGALKVAEGLTLWPALKEELLNFRRKINLKTAHDSYEHWRESDHDDLVLATALACWWATQRRSVLRVVAKPPGW